MGLVEEATWGAYFVPKQMEAWVVESGIDKLFAEAIRPEFLGWWE